MSGDADAFTRIRDLCEQHDVIAKARKSTRYPHGDRIGDAEILSRLCELAGSESCATDDTTLVARLGDEAGRLLREALVRALVEDHDLHAVVSAACERTGISNGAPQVAYCLVVLCQKADPERKRKEGPPRRSYELDVGEDGFDEQLAAWAGTIATNIAAWGDTHRKIFKEIDRFEYGTLKALAPISRSHGRDDIADALIDHVAYKLGRGQDLRDMSLATALAQQPEPAEYVFQSPLGQWAGLTAKRATPWKADPYDEERAETELVDEPATVGIEDRMEALFVRLAALRLTRNLLGEATGRLRAARSETDHTRYDDPADAALFKRFREGLDLVLQGLLDEERLLGQMLTYLVLAMAKSPLRHVVAILSLRADWLDAAVREHLASRMRAVVNGDGVPGAVLIAKAEEAWRKDKTVVPASRPKQLRKLRTDPRYRATEYMRLSALLDELPPVVGGDRVSIAAVPGAPPPDSVRAGRTQAAVELAAVDPVFGRSFRRYSMVRHGLD